VFWSATGYGEDEQKAPWVQRALRHDDGRVDGRRLRPVVIDTGRPEGDRARGRRRLPLVDARAADRADGARRRRRGAARAAGRLGAARAEDYSEQAFADRWHEIAAKHSLLEG
jgi:hypothetical protein